MAFYFLNIANVCLFHLLLVFTPMTLLYGFYDIICKALDCCVKGASDSEAEVHWINLSNSHHPSAIFKKSPICSDFIHL